MGDIGRVEQIALVAKLAIDLDAAAMLDDQLLRIFQSQTDQRIARAFPGATAMEAQFLHIEQTHLFFVVQAMEHGFVVRAQQFVGGQGAGQGGDVLPTGGAIFFIFQTVGRQLLQQQATGTTAVGVQLEAVPTCCDMTK